jgi:hypothetical protein
LVAGVLGIALGVPGVVLGHDSGSPSAIGLSAERLPPGGPLEIIGLAFAPGELLEVRLAGPEGETSLGSVTAGTDGGFAVVLSVPTAAAIGPHTVDVISASGIVQRATFEVDPAAPAPALTPSPARPAEAVGAVDLGGSAWVFLPLIVLGVIALVFVMVLVRRRPHAATGR